MWVVKEINHITAIGCRNHDPEMVSALTQNARDVSSIPALGTMFPIFITPTTLVAMTTIVYMLCMVWLLNLPCVCIYVIACFYVLVSIQIFTIPRGRM